MYFFTLFILFSFVDLHLGAMEQPFLNTIESDELATAEAEKFIRQVLGLATKIDEAENSGSIEKSSDKPITSEKIKKWQCTFPGCDKKFVRKHNGVEHFRRKHSKEKHYKCKFCAEHFIRADQRKTHMNNVHGEIEEAIRRVAEKLAKNN